jgi:hypothetical protein
LAFDFEGATDLFDALPHGMQAKVAGESLVHIKALAVVSYLHHNLTIILMKLNGNMFGGGMFGGVVGRFLGDPVQDFFHWQRQGRLLIPMGIDIDFESGAEYLGLSLQGSKKPLVF